MGCSSAPLDVGDETLWDDNGRLSLLSNDCVGLRSVGGVSSVGLTIFEVPGFSSCDEAARSESVCSGTASGSSNGGLTADVSIYIWCQRFLSRVRWRETALKEPTVIVGARWRRVVFCDGAGSWSTLSACEADILHGFEVLMCSVGDIGASKMICSQSCRESMLCRQNYGGKE